MAEPTQSTRVPSASTASARLSALFCSGSLRVMSYDVIEAADWDAALELVAGQRPDVVVTDLHMPEHSGVDIARLLRNHPELGHTPIIALTATPPRDDETISLFHSVLEKPCAAQDLQRALTEALQTHKH